MRSLLLSTAFAFLALCVACIVAAGESKESPQYPGHQDLSYYLHPDGTRVEIRTPNDWQIRREHILAGMQQAMGPLPRPEKPVPLDVQVVDEHRDSGIIRRKLAYHTDRDNYRVKAWLLMPANDDNSKRPAMLCLHQTTPNGKDSPAGLSDRPTLHYAVELARRGYVTLAPDYPSFGEHPYDFDADDYESGTMKAIYDNIRAVDLLQALPEVDGDRIGCIGHSLGGHNSLFTAAFDERIKAVITSCGFTSFHKYMAGDLKGWTNPRYMPLIATRYDSSPDKVPFDFHEVLAAIAPRAIFIMAPLRDDNFEVTGVRDVVKEVHPIFKLLGHPERLQAVYPDAAHDFPDAEREKAYEFLDRVLTYDAG